MSKTLSAPLASLAFEVYQLEDLALRHDLDRLPEGLTRHDARTEIARRYVPARQAFAMARAGFETAEEQGTASADDRHTIRGLEIALARVAETLGLTLAPSKRAA